MDIPLEFCSCFEFGFWVKKPGAKWTVLCIVAEEWRFG